jgi:hypothetical protein
VLETVAQRHQGKGTDAGRGEFDSQRHAVDSPTDLGNIIEGACTDRERGISGTGARSANERPMHLRIGGNPTTVIALPKHVQRLDAAISVHELPEDPAVGLRILSTRGNSDD